MITQPPAAKQQSSSTDSPWPYDLHHVPEQTPGLGPLIAWHRRQLGEEIPPALRDISLRSAYGAVSAAPLLERIRAAVSGPMLVLKGPEVAALYPSPILRPYGDLDILVENVERAETELLAAGFRHSGAQDDILPDYIHDLPLHLPGTALAIELHRRPGWLRWMNAPSNEELFATAIPSATGVEGVVTLPPAAHALFLAVHSWRHGPYHSHLQLIDIDLMRRTADQKEIERLAADWRLTNLWTRNLRVIDWLLHQSGPLPGRVDRYWARHLEEHRNRTLREYYIATRTKGLAAETFPSKINSITRDIAESFALRPGESPLAVARYTIRNLVTRSNAPAATQQRRR